MGPRSSISTLQDRMHINFTEAFESFLPQAPGAKKFHTVNFVSALQMLTEPHAIPGKVLLLMERQQVKENYCHPTHTLLI